MVIIQPKKFERVYVFIDGSNLYKSIKSENIPYKVDIKKLSENLCGENRRLVKICFYSAPVSQQDDPVAYKEQQRFFTALRKITYLELRLGNLRKRDKRFICNNCNKENIIKYRVEKGVDVRLAVDLLQYAFDDQYDTAILITEDGDFVPAVQEVKRLGKKVENAHFKESYLSKNCDRYILLTSQLIEECKIY